MLQERRKQGRRPIRNRNLGKLTVLGACILAMMIFDGRPSAETMKPFESVGGEAGAPFERAEYRRKRRAGADGTVKPTGLMDAKREIDRRRAVLGKVKDVQDAGLASWDWLGPTNIGGRVRAIVMHPTDFNQIWIGAAGGGIWKSNDAGSTWNPQDDFLPSLAVHTMVIDPTNTSILYAGTGEHVGSSTPGAGIFKTTNGGATWTQLASTAAWTYVNRLAQHPDSTGVLYAAASNKILKTIDGGTSWTEVYDAVFDELTDVEINPWSHNQIAAAGEATVVFSVDAGSTWSEVTPPGAVFDKRIEVAFGKAFLATYLYALSDSNVDPDPLDDEDEYYALLWKSDDLGATWTLKNEDELIFRDQVNYDNALWVDPTNHDRIIVGGIDLWRSTNGGTTLTRISDWTAYHNSSPGFSAHADQHAIIHHPGTFNGVTNKTIYVGNDGGIQKALDFTTVSEHSGWVNLGNGLGITQFYAGATIPDGSKVVGGTQDNSHLRYLSSGGPTAWFQSFTGDGGFGAINPINTQIIYGETQWLNFLKSTDGGTTYSQAATDLTDALDKDRAAFIAPFIMSPSNPNILFAAGHDVWKTTNAAGVWTSVMDPSKIWTISDYGKAHSIAMFGTQDVWVGYSEGKIAFTDNGGTSWTAVSPSAASGRSITDLAIDPFDATRVFATVGGYTDDTVFITEDSGSSWTQRTGTGENALPEIQVNAVTIHPTATNWIYIGTDLGVFASEDRGVTWSTTPLFGSEGHEGPVNVEVDDLFWAGDELIAATHGRGMYKTRPVITVYVDASAAGGGDGSLGSPFQQVSQAAAVAGNGTTVVIAAGTYDAPVTITKRTDIVVNGTVTIR